MLWCEELEEFVELADGAEIEVDEKKLSVVSGEASVKTIYTRDKAEKGSEGGD